MAHADDQVIIDESRLARAAGVARSLLLPRVEVATVKTRSNVALVLAAVGLAACSSSSSSSPARGRTRSRSTSSARRSSGTRTRSCRTPSARRSRTSQANFAVDIYQAVRKQPESVDKDLFLSPHSVSIALAMTYAGARGETAAEMKKALHFDLPDERLHTAFDYLDLALASRGKNARGQGRQAVPPQRHQLDLGSEGHRRSRRRSSTPSPSTTAQASTSSTSSPQTEKSRSTINGWVEEKTEKRIKNILPEGAVDADTRLVLVNAVYFNAAWAAKFEPRSDRRRLPFTKADGSSVQVSMMNRPGVPTLRTRRARRPTKAVETALTTATSSRCSSSLPTAGTFATFESSLTGGKVLDILAGLETKKVNLHFPKLKLDGAFGLKEPLQVARHEPGLQRRARTSAA